MAALLVCTAILSCSQEKELPMPQAELPTLPSLVGTEWEGSYLSPIEYQENTITMKLVWTVDFLSDTTGTLLVEISSPFSQTEYNDFAFSYSYDGIASGLLYTGGEEEHFDVNPVSQTLTMDMQMPVQLGEDTAEPTILGGVTTLYRVR